MLWNETATCKETCQKPAWWDPRLQLAPARDNYTENEEVTLSCHNGFQPSFTHVKCANRVQQLNNSVSLKRDTWLGRKDSGVWIQVQGNIVCIETCQKPHWDFRLQLTPDQASYKKNEEVMLSCPMGFQPPFNHVKCTGKSLSVINGKPVYREAWNGRDSRGSWINIQPKFRVQCLEKCQKPQWDPRFIFDQEQGTFNPNEVVKMKCPEGYWPPPMEIKCVTLKPREGSLIPHSGWIVRNGTDIWHPMEENLTCVDVLQVVPESLKFSSTSIKLNWTCMLPDMCQRIRARCRLEQHSSSNCKAEEVKGEEILQGKEGTFTCSPLQPFTIYSVTISLLPSTILYTRLLRTKEVVPDKPENLQLNPSTGSISWKALPSCKGEITGYQLNITTMRAEDDSFLDFRQVLVNQSVSEYVPPHQTAGRKYLVTVQGLTAAGAGPASQLEFFIRAEEQPRGPWPGSAVIAVVVVLLLIPLIAGILWFVLSRKRRALPSQAEEDHYTDLQPYENVHGDNYCVIETFLKKDAGKCGQDEEPFPKPLPIRESSKESEQ
ncbi:uncharacterized protein LOC134564327 [Prinia subflava]|uniref:uncharacterized protein LOC134564327 n=1 Tax=Prinia subflava TaxID=208062 RepID=UPI002FE1A3A8